MLSIPFAGLRIVPVFEPRLRAGGHFTNALYLLLGFSELCSYTSSTVNFFVYYFTGTKYRKTLRDLSIFGGKKQTKTGTERMNSTTKNGSTDTTAPTEAS